MFTIWLSLVKEIEESEDLERDYGRYVIEDWGSKVFCNRVRAAGKSALGGKL